MNNKIKQVTNVVDADRCDELLTKLIHDERQYNDTIDDMLDRYLKAVPNVDGVGIYKTNGILIAKKRNN